MITRINLILLLGFCGAVGACAQSNLVVDSYSPEEIVRQMKAITIPELTFREASLPDFVEFVGAASRLFSPEGASDEMRKRGVCIVLLPRDQRLISRAESCTEPTIVANEFSDTTVTMSVRYISLYDALGLMCEVAKLKWSIRHGVVILESIAEPRSVIKAKKGNLVSLPSFLVGAVVVLFSVGAGVLIGKRIT